MTDSDQVIDVTGYAMDYHHLLEPTPHVTDSHHGYHVLVVMVAPIDRQLFAQLQQKAIDDGCTILQGEEEEYRSQYFVFKVDAGRDNPLEDYKGFEYEEKVIISEHGLLDDALAESNLFDGQDVVIRNR